MGSAPNLKKIQKKHFLRHTNLERSWKSGNIDKNSKNQFKPLTFSKRSRKELQLGVTHLFFRFDLTHFVKQIKVSGNEFFQVTRLDTLAKFLVNLFSPGYLVSFFNVFFCHSF